MFLFLLISIFLLIFFFFNFFCFLPLFLLSRFDDSGGARNVEFAPLRFARFLAVR